LLDFAAAPARGRRDAMGILDRAPYLRPLREDRPLPKTVPAEYLDAVYAKADIVATPRIPGINPADWWRGLLVLAYNTGLRRRALFNLDWEDVDLDAALVKVPATIIKNKRAIAIPLNAVACLHLARIKRDTGRVFHWPYDKRTFDVTFAKLQWAAGIPAADHFGLHRIRKTAATVLWEDSPAAAQLVMGHTTAAMTIKHYVQAPGIMRAAIERMPQPTAFTGGNGSAGNAGGKADRQTRPKDQGNNDYAI
jgi:integrase